MTILTPARMMMSEMHRARVPSSQGATSPKMIPTRAASSVAEVTAASNIASLAVAFSVSDSVAAPVFLKNLLMSSLAAMARHSTRIPVQLYCEGSGSMILPTDCTIENMPAPRMTSEMVIVVRYSYLPKPKGCSLSAGLLARLMPASVSTDDSASDRLFSASSTMAMEFDSTPITAFAPQSATLETMPTALA